MGLHGAVEEQLKGNALDFERWSFFATAAAVDVGTTVLARSMSEKEFIRLLGYIYGDLHERFCDQATRAIKNYREGTARLLAEPSNRAVEREVPGPISQGYVDIGFETERVTCGRGRREGHRAEAEAYLSWRGAVAARAEARIAVTRLLDLSTTSGSPTEPRPP
jgi:hypothetical protein